MTSVDFCPLHLGRAQPPRVAADAFRLPFPNKSFDFVVCSLLLHQFGDAQIIELIRAFRGIARRALVVLDLERHPLPYYFLPATRWLFRWQELTVHDGRISVEAGFRASELAALARAAGGAGFTVRKHRPWFRLSLVLPAH